MLNNPSFSVAISTFNRNEDLLRCLKALRKQTYSYFDVVISNGGEHEGVRKVAQEFSDLKIKIVNQEKKGIVEGRNLGWRNSQGDIVCLIDDDLVVKLALPNRRSIQTAPAIAGAVEAQFRLVEGFLGPVVVEPRRAHEMWADAAD